MKIVIVEDELPAAKRLSKLILQFRPRAEILNTIDSVENAVSWFQQRDLACDLIFMDIQLADGLSFDIFTQVTIQTPIIFTTAYDQYTLKAFKVNSIDYLLKPIDPEELDAALHKFDQVYQQPVTYNQKNIEQLLQSLVKPTYKERFIIKIGQQLTYISISEIYYFYSDDGIVYARIENGKRHAIDYTLDQLEQVIRPTSFFRINRKAIVGIDAIHKIANYFNSRLKLELKPKAEFEVIVSRDRVSDFKRWLDK